MRRLYCFILSALLTASVIIYADEGQKELVKQIEWIESKSSDPLAVKEFCETHFASWLVAVQKSYPEAEFLVGLCFYSGFAVTSPNKKVALEWCTKSAAKGCPAAMNFLASHYMDAEPPDIKTGRPFLEKAARLHYSPAMFKLGLRHDYGFGLEKDSAKALSWYRKAAAKGNADAMCQLGICFETGRGVDVSETTAVSWYRKAAQLDHSEACHRLALHYIRGTAADKDLKRAVHWLEKGAKGRHVPSMYLLGKCYITGQGTSENYLVGLEWYRKAAVLGSHDAMYAIALIYLSGKGVPKDPHRAAVWLTKAAEAGNADAELLLKKIKSQ